MAKYICKRIIMALIVLLLIASLTFLLMNLVPGGPFLSEKAPSQAVLDALNAKYGLDQPLHIQLKNYLVNAVHGDFGVSLKMQKNRPVTDIIIEMFPVSLRVGIVAVIVAVICGVPMGCIAAYYRGGKMDSFLRVVMTLGISIPGFVVATLLLIFFGVKLHWLPTMGLNGWTSYIMPSFTLAFYPMCYLGRLSRSSMLDAINQDYIRTAKAKGVSKYKVIFKHALRNSLLPIITYAGPEIAYIITGSMVVETVFTVGGIGSKFVSAITNRDYTMIMATTIFLATLMVVANVICDLLYKVVDPRIKYE